MVMVHIDYLKSISKFDGAPKKKNICNLKKK